GDDADGGGDAAADPVTHEKEAIPGALPHKYCATNGGAGHARGGCLRVSPRWVCVGLTEQDAVLALGVVPVAVTKCFGDAPGFIFPWAVDKLGDADLPEVLEDSNGVQVEKIPALRPDLIIGQYAGVTEKDYELLSKIAPTVAQPEA